MFQNTRNKVNEEQSKSRTRKGKVHLSKIKTVYGLSIHCAHIFKKMTHEEIF